MYVMKILVIEDEHKIANSIKEGLEQERYVADVSYSGGGGYDMASSGDYDLIILDLMLPDLSGIDVCKKLRKEGINTPVLILTAKGQISDKVLGLDAGADDYLTKPFSFEELLARVRALSRRPKEALGTVLTVSDLALDARSYEVTRAGNPITLSRKEFSLLEYLMRNAGKVRTKEQIINQVWDYDSDIYTNTVEVYVKNIRKKVDAPFKSPLIHTVRGFGYKLEADK